MVKKYGKKKQKQNCQEKEKNFSGGSLTLDLKRVKVISFSIVPLHQVLIVHLELI